MLLFLLKRAALTLPTFVALMFVTFMMVRLVPGDPWIQSLAAQRRRDAGQPAETPDPRRLFESRPPSEW